MKIFVAGHNGMVGSSIVRFLKKANDKIITADKKELNLLNQNKVKNFFKHNKIDQVYLAAAKVGGIHANNIFPAEFIYKNLMIQSNVINSAFLGGVKKLLFLGSSCIYPKNINEPIKENKLLTGKLEATNEPYAIAKIAGIKMCESYNRQYGKKLKIDYRCIMPPNLYGPGDNYHPKNSHVIPALIYRFHNAKIKKLPHVMIWGSGKPRREFLYVDDLAKASIKIMNLNKKVYDKFTTPMNSHINIGTGKDITIMELAIMIKRIINFKGEIITDNRKLDGIEKKLLDNTIIKKMNIKFNTSLKNGLIKTYKHYIASLS